MLGHYGSQGRLYYPVFEEFEEGPFEEAPPDEVLLPRLPLHLFDGAEHLYVSLEEEGQHLEEERDEVGNVRVLTEVADRQDGHQRPQDEQKLPEELPKL